MLRIWWPTRRTFDHKFLTQNFFRVSSARTTEDSPKWNPLPFSNQFQAPCLANHLKVQSQTHLHVNHPRPLIWDRRTQNLSQTHLHVNHVLTQDRPIQHLRQTHLHVNHPLIWRWDRPTQHTRQTHLHLNHPLILDFRPTQHIRQTRLHVNHVNHPLILKHPLILDRPTQHISRTRLHVNHPLLLDRPTQLLAVQILSLEN